MPAPALEKEASDSPDTGEIPLVEQYFLVREGHCHGFAEQRSWTIQSWLGDQGINQYNSMNDRYMRLISRYKSVADGAVLSEKHATLALLCLYQQDRFLDFIKSVDLFSRVRFTGDLAELNREECIRMLENDSEQRLLFAFDWMELVLFGSSSRVAPFA